MLTKNTVGEEWCFTSSFWNSNDLSLLMAANKDAKKLFVKYAQLRCIVLDSGKVAINFK